MLTLAPFVALLPVSPFPVRLLSLVCLVRGRLGRSLGLGSYSLHYYVRRPYTSQLPLTTPWCHGTPSPCLAATVHILHSIPNTRQSPSLEPSVAPNASRFLVRHFSQCYSLAPLPGSSPLATVQNITRFGNRPSACLATALAQSSPYCRILTSTLWHPTIWRVLA